MKAISVVTDQAAGNGRDEVVERRESRQRSTTFVVQVL